MEIHRNEGSERLHQDKGNVIHFNTESVTADGDGNMKLTPRSRLNVNLFFAVPSSERAQTASSRFRTRRR